MKFHEIPMEQTSVRVNLISTYKGALKEGMPVMKIAPNESISGAFDLLLADGVISVRPFDEKGVKRLADELSRFKTMLAQISSFAPDSSFEINIVFFRGDVVLMDGDTDIGIDEYVIENYQRIKRKKTDITINELGKSLYSEFCYVHNGISYFFMLAGPAAEDIITADEQIEPGKESGVSADPAAEEDNEWDDYLFWEKPVKNESAGNKEKFCVVSKKLSFSATEKKLEDGHSVFVATKLTGKRTRTDKALKLARGRLSFVDWTTAGKISMMAEAQLAIILKEDSSYLKKWDEFGDAEGKVLLDNARRFDVIYYKEAEQDRDGITTLKITEATDFAYNELASSNDMELELVSDPPIYISNPSLTFSEFSKYISKEPRKRDASYYKVVKYDKINRTVSLKTETLAEPGMLILSLQGEITQIKRRNYARKLIIEGRAANPWLGSLLEKGGTVTSLRMPTKQKPLTAFVLDKIFKNPPTQGQREAIETALNTPDIALIQGPPGTGKTTVIAALCERLNEIAVSNGVNIAGQVLLTGFQHDAVENMMSRMSLYGIPVPKFGKRGYTDENATDQFERTILEWRDEITLKLREKNPELARIAQESEIQILALQYINTPTSELAAALAKKIAQIPASVLGMELAGEAERLSKQLSVRAAVYSDGNNRLIAAARQIRIRDESFLDDGPERAEDMLDINERYNVLEKDERCLLEKAGAWDTKRGVPPFISEIKELKKTLLTRLTEPPHFKVEKPNDEFLKLSEAAIKQIKKNGLSANDKKLAALSGFLAAIEGDFYGTLNAVSSYSFAFAATVQQSANENEIKRIKRMKGITDNDASIEYEYVIVDEAARVSPRDLMIPMAQGKRIILVGDHRQLPHLIDEEIASQMEEGESSVDENEWIKKSMFEYLFTDRLKALQEADGITRLVTLDEQFRMHPLLGDFISKNFYERFSKNEKFGSGLPESFFSHNLPGTHNKPAAWLDVPLTKGGHKRKDTSYIRHAEAEAIVTKLSEWIKSEQGKDLTYGIISFYKAQAELIESLFRTRSISEKQVFIGTVDSFQGKEFDVVFLSMVRTPEVSDMKKKDARKMFGYLCVYNRLNVSMSRQKKLLVVVGDQTLLTNSLAEEHIPGLVNFHTLCKEKGAFLTCS